MGITSPPAEPSSSLTNPQTLGLGATSKQLLPLWVLTACTLQVSEEVGLTPQQLQLVNCGRPVPVDDERRHFLVYPFFFNLVDLSATVTLNWENVAFDWVVAR
jgi:hypothetical protein